MIASITARNVEENCHSHISDYNYNGVAAIG